MSRGFALCGIWVRKNSIVKIKTIFMIKSEKTLTEELSALAALIKIFDAFEEQRVCGKSKSLLPILKETAVRIMEDVRYKPSEYRSFFYGKDRYRTDEVLAELFIICFLIFAESCIWT